MNVLRALVFDFDGTIAETERHGHRVAYNLAFEDLGLDDRWDEATYGALLGVAGGRERLEAYFERTRPADGVRARADLARRMHLAKRHRFDALGATLAPRPGVERLVREARANGVRVAIATTASPDGVNAFFAGNESLRHAFEAIVAGDDVPRKKPAPDAYVLALERLACGAHEALAIEDSSIGLQAARAAGIATLVTPSGYTQGEDFTGALAVLSSLGDPDAPARAATGPDPSHGVVDLAYARTLIA